MSNTGFVSTNNVLEMVDFVYKVVFWGGSPGYCLKNTKGYQTHDQLTFGQLVVVMRHLYPVILGEYDL